MVASFGGVGGLLSVVAFPLSAAPEYRAGVWLTLALQIGSIFVVVLLMAWFRRANKIADAALEIHVDELPTERPTESRRSSEPQVVDSNAFIEGLDSFRYIL